MIAMAQIFHRAQSAAIGSVPNLDVPIHVFQLDPRTATPQFAAQIMADVAAMVHAQAKIIFDPAGNRAGFKPPLLNPKELSDPQIR